jgi:Ca2+-binding RTX toxin-like protein
LGPDGTGNPDIYGAIAFSNGHNVFGSDVVGNVPGDRENIAASAIFAAIDPDTGGGLLSANGIVPLKNAITNPALSGAGPLAASDLGQLGTIGRPSPAGGLPDIGAIEFNQPLSTTASANNDVLTGNAAANTIDGLAGADFVKGLAGNDTLHGGKGGDLLDGGTGNDRLFGDAGIDIVFYGGSTKVAVDLSLATDKAVRGNETDTLHNVEGAIGSSGNDDFKGNEYNNYFQGGLGTDNATGGFGRDLYDFDAVAESKAGASRDVITDFTHLRDKIDLTGIDADRTVPGDQAFHWVGTAALAGPGELGYFISGFSTIIRASNDADGTAELQIQLTAVKALTAVDFYF